MEAFVSRKRRRISPPIEEGPIRTADVQLHAIQDDDSTELKLAILASLHPNIEQNILLDFLLSNEGSVELTAQALSNPEADGSRQKTTSGSLAYQSSISKFASQPAEGDRIRTKRPKSLTKKGKTLHLYSPEDVAAHTPCSIIHNFLPQNEANALLEELIKEAPTFGKATFKLFDNVVQSPHSASFYVRSLEEAKRQKTEYLYNGSYLTDVRQLTPHLLAILPNVEATVNAAIAHRIKHHYPNGQKLRYQSPTPWIPNAAFVNSYDGPAESVGYHSDQLTYLGPRAVIGSLSLGVAREFRVRRIVPRDEDDSAEATSSAADAGGQISIHLPHNSLLVMHAEMQEEWKHSIAPAQAIDPHPISGKRRINVTYRYYRESFHPRFTPRCKCGVATVLRCVQRKKGSVGRYFWGCHVGNQPVEGQEGCGFFEWADFDDDGEPIWKKRVS